jgi:hypothetical protein
MRAVLLISGPRFQNPPPWGQVALNHGWLGSADHSHRSKTIDALFARGDSWEEVARYAAFHMQVASLHLPPWQPAPCGIGNMASALADPDEQRGWRSAALLRQRMERCGVSKYHPDPVAACEAAERAAAV